MRDMLQESWLSVIAKSGIRTTAAFQRTLRAGNVQPAYGKSLRWSIYQTRWKIRAFNFIRRTGLSPARPRKFGGEAA